MDTSAMVRQLVGDSLGGAPEDAEAKGRQQSYKLYYAAMLEAGKNGCDCKVCRYVRRSNDIMTAGVDEEIASG